jgi:hypothetical protein
MPLPKPDLDLPADATPAERCAARAAWWVGYWVMTVLIVGAISGAVYLATPH